MQLFIYNRLQSEIVIKFANKIFLYSLSVNTTTVISTCQIRLHCSMTWVKYNYQVNIATRIPKFQKLNLKKFLLYSSNKISFEYVVLFLKYIVDCNFIELLHIICNQLEPEIKCNILHTVKKYQASKKKIYSNGQTPKLANIRIA